MGGVLCRKCKWCCTLSLHTTHTAIYRTNTTKPMSKRHADSTPDEKPAKRRRCEADEVSADPYDAVCCMCRENQQDSLGAILAQHFAPDSRNAGAAHVSARGGETERTLPAPLDVCDNTGMTPLMICAANDHVGCLVLLLEAGAGLDVVTPDGLSALMCATVGGVACLKELLTRGASLVPADGDGDTALHYAATMKDNQVDLVNMLLKHGASVEASNRFGLTPLLLAFQRGNKPAAVALLEGGASLAAVDSDGSTALHHATKNNNQADLVNMLLKHGASVAASNNFGVTPLLLAFQRGNEPAVVALLEGGASLAAVDSDGNTALHHAASNNNNQADLVNILLSRGLDLEVSNNVGTTPLHMAIGNDNKPAVVALLSRGASLATKDCDGETALHYAARLQSVRSGILNMLLKHGASVEAVNESGATPLHMAVAQANEPAVVALLSRGASSATEDCNGNTALHHAARLENNQAGLVNILLKHGASIEAGNNFGTTPLHLAIVHGNKPAVVALLSRGASLATEDSVGDSALHHAARVENNQLELVNMLLKHGAAIEAVNKFGVTPLLLAFQKGNKAAVVALLAKGASLSSVDHVGNTALHHAAISKNNQADLVNMLLKHGASIEAGDKVGITPLHMAVAHANKPAVVALLSRGASLATQDSVGDTALHHAARVENNQTDLVNMLLKHGASIEAGNESGITPLLVAFQAGNEPAAVALLEGGASLASVDSDGNTALHHVAISTNNNQAGLVNIILKHGASVETLNKAGVTPLHMAVAHDNEPAVVALLSRGASLATKDGNGDTALHHAARLQNNEADLVNMLLKHGASIEAVNNSGWSPLIQAILRDNEPGALALLEGGALVKDVQTSTTCRPLLHETLLRGLGLCAHILARGISACEPCANGVPPISYAALGGNVAAGELILQHGVSISSADVAGSTPLMLSSEKGHKGFTEFLLKHGADVDVCGEDGTTALHSAVQSGDADLCKMLVEHGVPLDAVDEDGHTALAASLSVDPAVCQVMIDAGAQLDVANRVGYSPLLSACEAGQSEFVKMLLDAGVQLRDARVSRDTDNVFTALMLAADGGHVEAVRHLLDCQGVDVNEQGANACTALHHAAQEKHADVVELLLQHGADKALRDNDGDTAADCASVGGCPECCRLLR